MIANEDKKKFKNLPTAREWWTAIRWVLLVFTGLILLTMAGSFVSYETVVAQGHPWLPSIHCTGCSFCGMTRSFCAMSAGLWQDAFRWNSAGPFLYTIGWIWLFGFFVWIFGFIKKNMKLQTVFDYRNKIIKRFF